MKYKNPADPGETVPLVKIKVESGELEIIKSSNRELTRETGRRGSSLGEYPQKLGVIVISGE